MPWHGDHWIDPAIVPISIPAVCPACSPDTYDSRTMQAVLCHDHAAVRDGVDDCMAQVSSGTPSGAVEAGGNTNRAMCDFLHRRIEGVALPDPEQSPSIIEG